MDGEPFYRRRCNGVRIEDPSLRLRSPLLRHDRRFVSINWLAFNDVISLYYACAGGTDHQGCRWQRPPAVLERLADRRPRRTVCRSGLKKFNKRREVNKFILSRTGNIRYRRVAYPESMHSLVTRQCRSAGAEKSRHTTFRTKPQAKTEGLVEGRLVLLDT